MYKLLILPLLFFSLAVPVLAVEDSTLIPAECLGNQANLECNLTAVEKMAIMVAQYIMGLAGSAALLLFVYGGILMIYSKGDSKGISKAKDILTKTVIGMVLIFCSGLVVRTLINVLAGRTPS